ncbi:hypothetical protein B0H13DRAFT_2102522 [Mycena leptocephala]|nr:hypothetical protein B0H13DRAFT_2102522 [Mycena leptocephala]
MKSTYRKNTKNASTSLLATSVPTYKVRFHTDASAPKSEERYIGNMRGCLPPAAPVPLGMSTDGDGDSPSLPFPDAAEEEPAGAVPSYETTVPCDETGAASKTRQTVAHLNELKAQEAVFLQTLLLTYRHSSLLTPCSCGLAQHVRNVGCRDCIQAELLCSQCWLDKHRTTPTHWALVWNAGERFFEKHNFCRVLKNARGAPEFQQLLQAGIFPGSVKEPKTYYRQLRSQGKGSAYNFVLVLQRMADPFFADSVPDIYVNFLAITRFHQHLDILMRRGHAHGLDEALPGETDRPYPNRPMGYLGLQCAACLERGVNMPFHVDLPRWLRHLIPLYMSTDGNFKLNLFFKRDNGTDITFTDGNMYFPRRIEFDRLVKQFVVSEEDKEVPCKAHIGSICHQGQVKYGNTAVSGVVGCTCDHAVAGSFVDMLKGSHGLISFDSFALGTYAQRQYLRHTNSPLHGPATNTPTVFSYDSWCSFVVNLVTRAVALFPEDTWLHELLASAEGQIPADHINGHGEDCQTIWQSVYFACRAHFHGETAEVIWAFLNALGSSTRQMTGPVRHDTINFVVDAWNTLKVLRQAELLAAERLDALQLFELHMAVLEDLSKQHVSEVAGWSRLRRTPTKSAAGKHESVYQHKSTRVLTIESVLASLVAEERGKLTPEDGDELRTPVAQWIHDGMDIECQQVLVIALLASHREDPLQDTWATITKLRDSLNVDLKKFRECQRTIYPCLKLSAIDVDEPELMAVQLPLYRMKHVQRAATGVGTRVEDAELREVEIKLRCGEANSGIIAVQAASLVLSAVKKTRDLDYRGQAGITRSKQSLQKAELMKSFEITMKDTHLHRATGDSQLLDGTAWYLQSGVKLSRAAVASTPSTINGDDDTEDDEPRLLAGTQTLKHSGKTLLQKVQTRPKTSEGIVPEDVVVEASSSEAEESDVDMPLGAKQAKQQRCVKKVKRSDGWIWLESMTSRQKLGEGKLAEYKRESDHVQWFRAEAEMYHRLEVYERKHAELWRIIQRYRRDSEVWGGRADREEASGGINGTVTFARMQAAMYKRLEHNAKVIFKSPDSGVHHDRVSAATFDELVLKIDQWRDEVFKWMDEMGIHRAYKDF